MWNNWKNMKKTIGMVSILLFMAFEPVHAAATGTLKGRVTDAETSDALPGASVVVRGTSIGSATDLDGNYVIHNVPAGQQTIVVSYVGYVSKTVEVNVVENEETVADFNLTATAITGKTVLVTAQAFGQMESINQQLSANRIVNVVSAEKMKELPDANIAESIGRLPGVSLQRDAGEANAVVIRGLSPKYNMIEIEGVPMVSTYFGDRGIDLSLLNDDLVKGVELSKTLRPDMDADALGGTVNLTLRTAQEGMHFDVRGNGGYTKLDDSYGNYKLAATGSSRFLDNKLGVLIQGNIEQKMLPTDQFNAAYAAPQVTTSVVNGDTTQYSYMDTQSATLRETQTTRRRYAASVILDYASSLFDVKFYTVYDQKRDTTTTRSNQSTFLNSQYFYQIFSTDTKTEQRTHSLQLLFKPGDMQIPISLSYTRGDLRSPKGQQIDIYGFKPNDFPPIKEASTRFTQPSILMDYLGVQDPQYSLLQEPWMIDNALTDQSYDAKVDWKVPFRVSDEFSGVLSVGGKYHSADRTSNRDQYGLYIQYGQGRGAREDLIAYLKATYPGFHTDETLQTGIQAQNFVDPNYTGGSILGYAIGPQYNVSQLMSINSYFYQVHGPSSTVNEYLLAGLNSYNQDYVDKENTKAGYIMGEFNVGSKLTVVPGVRFQQEEYDITSRHILVDPLSPTGIVGSNPPLNQTKRKNPDWFPSVNIKYKATDNVQMMSAAYRSVSLPSFTDINPVLVFNPGGTPTQITGGNPLLRPSTAWNFDLGVSVFSNEIGLFTVNLFYKEITDLIYAMQNYQPFLTSPIIGAPSDIMDRLPAASYYDTSFAKTLTGLISTNVPMNNPERAYLRGIELSWQTHLWYLPGLLSGIVLDLNASFMSSSQMYPYFDAVRTGGSVIRPIYTMVYKMRSGHLQDQPEATYNAILGWDYKGFSSRFSFRYQKLTLTSLDTRYSIRDAYYDNVLLIDIAVKQRIIDNLAVFANVTNVNSHIDNYYLNYYNGLDGTSGQLPTSKQTYGLDTQLGLSYNF